MVVQVFDGHLTFWPCQLEHSFLMVFFMAARIRGFVIDLLLWNFTSTIQSFPSFHWVVNTVFGMFDRGAGGKVMVNGTRTEAHERFQCFNFGAPPGTTPGTSGTSGTLFLFYHGGSLFCLYLCNFSVVHSLCLFVPIDFVCPTERPSHYQCVFHDVCLLLALWRWVVVLLL